jgi:integrase
MRKNELFEYNESVGELFLTGYIKENAFSISHLLQLKTILRRLNELSAGIDFRLIKTLPEAPPPLQFEGGLVSYLETCSGIGNKNNTVARKRGFCREFLTYLADAGCSGFFELNTKYICQAALKLTNKDSYAIIRSFLRHLYETGATNHDLSGIIPKYRRRIPLPTTYTDDEINRTAGVIDRSTKTGKRNYAIFLLASRLGLRSGDIAEMTFDNINFDRNTIELTQNKNGLPLSLPLIPEIREAILVYIKEARPNVENNFLFNRANAPFDKITTSIIRQALTEYFIAAGIDISNKRHGPHTLRSSMASSMINRGIPYDVVRKTLGHAHPQAIKHYAKVDIENLRFYAVDVPAPTGTFAMILQGRERPC